MPTARMPTTARAAWRATRLYPMSSSCVPAALETLLEPVTLACGHNFELQMLRCRMQASERRCPACGTDICVDVDSLCVNSDVQRLVAQLLHERHARSHMTSTLATAATSTTCTPLTALASNVSTVSTVVHVPSASAQPILGTAVAAAAAAAVLTAVSSGANSAASNAVATKRHPPVKLSDLRLGRDTEEIVSLLATGFARQLGSVNDPSNSLTCDLPTAATKRVMKQDAVELSLRLVSADGPPLMAYASELFIGLLTHIAWHSSTSPSGRNTVDLRDIQRAVACTSMFDFLQEAIGGTLNGNNELISHFNAKQAARIDARRSEKTLSVARGFREQGRRMAHASRKKHAMNRQRSLRGRFLGRAEVDAVSYLTGGAIQGSSDPKSSAPANDKHADFRPKIVDATEQAHVRSATYLGHGAVPLRSVYPLANVARVMSRSLPLKVKISKDAKECVCELAGELTALVAMEASCWQVGTSRAVTSTTLLHAFSALDLDGFVGPLRVWLGRTSRSKFSGSGFGLDMGTMGLVAVGDAAMAVTSLLFDGEELRPRDDGELNDYDEDEEEEEDDDDDDDDEGEEEVDEVEEGEEEVEEDERGEEVEEADKNDEDDDEEEYAVDNDVDRDEESDTVAIDVLSKASMDAKSEDIDAVSRALADELGQLQAAAHAEENVTVAPKHCERNCTEGPSSQRERASLRRRTETVHTRHVKRGLEQVVAGDASKRPKRKLRSTTTAA